MDVVITFLNSYADTDFYVQVSPGWKEPCVASTYPFVCKLWKAMYGLKQAPRFWQRHLRGCLAEVNFELLASDNCWYLNKQTRIIIATYVDDFPILGKQIEHINRLKKKLADKF